MNPLKKLSTIKLNFIMLGAWLLCLTVVLPFLISAKSTTLVLLGFALIIGLIWLTYVTAQRNWTETIVQAQERSAEAHRRFRDAVGLGDDDEPQSINNTREA